MKIKKTIAVIEIIRLANLQLKQSVDEAREMRQGIILLLERILHDTENYSGYGYLSASSMKDQPGKSVGIIRNSDGKPDFTGCDDTRRFYLC